MIRKLLYAASAMVILGVLCTSSAGAVFNERRTTFLTFNGPVRLPGVTLPPGTYLFELAAPSSPFDMVRVTSRDRRRVYFGAITKLIERPKGTPLSQMIVFGESPTPTPPPIKAWFSPDERTGRQFIY